MMKKAKVLIDSFFLLYIYCVGTFLNFLVKLDLIYLFSVKAPN